MRKVDPDAAPVRVPLREWRATVRDIAKLNHQIAEQMGQLAQHIGGLLPETSDSFKLRFIGLTNNMRTKPGQAPVHGPQLAEALDRSGSILPGPSDLLAKVGPRTRTAPWTSTLGMFVSGWTAATGTSIS